MQIVFAGGGALFLNKDLHATWEKMTSLLLSIAYVDKKPLSVWVWVYGCMGVIQMLCIQLGFVCFLNSLSGKTIKTLSPFPLVL